MKNAYFAATEEVGTGLASAPQENTVLLACEQIITEGSAKLPKHEQNAIIRLAASVKKYGILEPISVKLATSERGYPTYVLIDGARRLRAAVLAGLGRVPCVILPPQDVKCLQMAEISAIKRQNLHYLTQAERFSYLIHTLHITQDELARRLHLSQSAVANKLRLLQYTPEERHFLQNTDLSERHARALLRIRDESERREAMAAAARRGLNVADTEALVAELLGERIATESLAAAQNAPKSAEFEEKSVKNYPAAAQTSQIAPIIQGEGGEQDAGGQGIVPRKFALRDLTPLYNSIERTLGIFKKTGVSAEYNKDEDEFAARITIYIPKRG